MTLSRRYAPSQVIAQLRSPTGVRGKHVVRAVYHLYEAATTIEELYLVLAEVLKHREQMPPSVQAALAECEQYLDLTIWPGQEPVAAALREARQYSELPDVWEDVPSLPMARAELLPESPTASDTEV